MSRRRAPLLITITLALLSTLVVVSAQQTGKRLIPSLSIEIDTSGGLLTLPASVNTKTLAAYIPVPPAVGNTSLKEQASAVKIIPRTEGDKLRVNVYAVYGDISKAKTCSDMKSLKTTSITSYLVGEGDKVVVSELDKFGIELKEDQLAFRVVPQETPQFIKAATASLQQGCICPLCNGIGCCADEGQCRRCSGCGIVCCT